MLAHWAPKRGWPVWIILRGLDGQSESGPLSIFFFTVASHYPTRSHTFSLYRSLILNLDPPLCSQSILPDLSGLWVNSNGPDVSHLLQHASSQRKHLLIHLVLLQRGDACYLPPALLKSPWGLLEQSPPSPTTYLISSCARPLSPEGPFTNLGWQFTVSCER